MKKTTYKNFFVLVVVILFISLSMAPSIFAEMKTKNNEMRYTTKNSGYNLLIITPSKYVNSLQPLVTHKNNVGMTANLVTLDEVYNHIGSMGRDNAEKIKYYIKYAMETWGVSYVLLAGNFRQMPIRYVYNAEPWPVYPEPFFISELYYADIYDQNGEFSSWDTNRDGVYGEWVGSEAQDKLIDLYPDVSVGRLACVNTYEVTVMVNKIITYETTAFNTEWFKRMVVVAGDTYPPGSYNFSTDAFEGEENTQTALEYMAGFEVTKLWTSLGTLTGTQDVIDAINTGCGFLFFEGHGNPMVWATNGPNNTSVSGLSTRGMKKLANNDMVPICVVGGCHNSQFDVSLINLLQEPAHSFMWGTFAPECWSWKLTRLSNGGSIATLGNTALGMSKEDKDSRQGAGDFMDVQLFYEYGVNGTQILGDAWRHAITNYLNTYPINWSTPAAEDSAYDAKTVQQWVLFGDPSLKIGGY